MRARSAVRRLTREWGVREGFAQEGLLAERTITPPRRRPDARRTGRESRDDRPAPSGDVLAIADFLDPDALARLRARAEAEREQRERPLASEPRECA